MKKLLVLILLCLTFSPGLVHSQTSLYGGFRIDNDFLSTNGLPHKQSPFNLDPAFNLGLRLGGNFALEGRLGLLLSEDYGGMQLSFYAKENIFRDNIYLLGGVNFLSSFNTSHGNLIHDESNGSTHTLLGGGIGFSASDNFSLEFQYLKTLNGEFGRTYDYYYHDGYLQPINRYWKLYNIFKIGFAYNFSFTSNPAEEKTALEIKGSEESPDHAKNFYGGFRIDYDYMSVSAFSNVGSTLHLGPTMNLGLKLSRDFSLEGRFGLLLSEDIGGTQFGLYARENILSNVIYVLGGVNLLHTTKGPLYFDNWTNSSYFSTLVGGGLGINASNSFSLEFQYLKALNKKLGQTYFQLLDGKVDTQNWKLGDVIKVGFAYNFSLPF